MKVLLLLVLLLQVVFLATKELGEVSGYMGEDVTLPSGVDPSWNISLIEWSILTNNTWIAIHRSGKTNVNRFWRYQGRLELNISTGDLGIRGLTREDAMVYTVDLKNTERNQTKVRNKVRLIVNDRLSQPVIQPFIDKTVKEGHCRLALQCTSPVRGVTFTWQAQPAVMNMSFWTSSRNVSYLLASFSLDNSNVNNKVQFTCTTSMDGQKTSSVYDVTNGCQEETLKEAKTSAWGYVLVFLFGCSVTGMMVAVCYYYKGQIGSFLRAKKKCRDSGNAEETEAMEKPSEETMH